jgi:hypothetical protein
MKIINISEYGFHIIYIPGKGYTMDTALLGIEIDYFNIWISILFFNIRITRRRRKIL